MVPTGSRVRGHQASQTPSDAHTSSASAILGYHHMRPHQRIMVRASSSRMEPHSEGQCNRPSRFTDSQQVPSRPLHQPKPVRATALPQPTHNGPSASPPPPPPIKTPQVSTSGQVPLDWRTFRALLVAWESRGGLAVTGGATSPGPSMHTPSTGTDTSGNSGRNAIKADGGMDSSSSLTATPQDSSLLAEGSLGALPGSLLSASLDFETELKDVSQFHRNTEGCSSPSPSHSQGQGQNAHAPSTVRTTGRKSSKFIAKKPSAASPEGKGKANQARPGRPINTSLQAFLAGGAQQPGNNVVPLGGKRGQLPFPDASGASSSGSNGPDSLQLLRPVYPAPPMLCNQSGSFAHKLRSVERGCLLLARHSGTRFFNRAVILITAHDDARGSLGYVLNRPSPLLVSQLEVVTEAAAGLKRVLNDQRLHVGGPVHLDHVTLLHGYRGVSQAQEIAEGVYLGGLASAIELVSSGLARAQDFHLMLGMSGWGPNQLQQEVDRGLWHVVSASPDLCLPQACSLGQFGPMGQSEPIVPEAGSSTGVQLPRMQLQQPSCEELNASQTALPSSVHGADGMTGSITGQVADLAGSALNRSAAGSDYTSAAAAAAAGSTLRPPAPPLCPHYQRIARLALKGY